MLRCDSNEVNKSGKIMPTTLYCPPPPGPFFIFSHNRPLNFDSNEFASFYDVNILMTIVT